MGAFVSREHMRDELRSAMPTVAAVVDEYRRVFGGVRVTYAEEGGQRAGTPMRFEVKGVAHDGAIIVSLIKQETGA